MQAITDGAAERRDVEVDVIALEHDLAPVYSEPRTAKARPQDAEGPAQRAASVLRLRFRPQELGQRLACDGPIHDRDVREQGDRLAGVHNDRPTIGLDLRRAEEGDPQRQDGLLRSSGPP